MQLQSINNNMSQTCTRMSGTGSTSGLRGEVGNDCLGCDRRFLSFGGCRKWSDVWGFSQKGAVWVGAVVRG